MVNSESDLMKIVIANKIVIASAAWQPRSFTEPAE
jgi:hypothetical protein